MTLVATLMNHVMVSQISDSLENMAWKISVAVIPEGSLLRPLNPTSSSNDRNAHRKQGTCNAEYYALVSLKICTRRNITYC